MAFVQPWNVAKMIKLVLEYWIICRHELEIQEDMRLQVLQTQEIGKERLTNCDVPIMVYSQTGTHKISINPTTKYEGKKEFDYDIIV